MAYREPLPPDCPPGDAAAVGAARIFYRLVWNDPPADSDFWSFRALMPERNFRDECRARGLSVFADRKAAEELQATKGWQGSLICQVTILPNAGPIKKTGKNDHYTWWPLAGFAILQRSRIG